MPCERNTTMSSSARCAPKLKLFGLVRMILVCSLMQCSDDTKRWSDRSGLPQSIYLQKLHCTNCMLLKATYTYVHTYIHACMHAVSNLACHNIETYCNCPTVTHKPQVQKNSCSMKCDQQQYLMAPFEVQAKTLFRPVHKPWISPVNSLTSLTFLGTARAMSHWHKKLQLQLQHIQHMMGLFGHTPEQANNKSNSLAALAIAACMAKLDRASQQIPQQS